MDILKRYEERQPRAAQPAPRAAAGSEYGFLVRAVMRLSGGRIHEVRQANYILLGVATVAVILSLVLLFSGGEGTTLDIEKIIATPQFLP